jgi:hypothetical protein
MRATTFLFLGSGAAAMLVVAAGAQASGAAVSDAQGSQVPVASVTPAAAPGDPSTTITFTVTTGALTLSVPSSATLGSGAPNTTIGPAAIGPCSVVDLRAQNPASWTVTAAQTDFDNITRTGAPLIPATAASYLPGSFSVIGTINVVAHNISSLTNTEQDVLTATGGVGNTTTSWDPTVAVFVPSTAVGGTYTGTLTQSVS